LKTSHVVRELKGNVSLRARTFMAALTAVSLVAMSLSGLSAASLSTIPDYAVRVGHGNAANNGSWSIWMFGKHGEGNCWAIRTVAGGFPMDDSYCGFSVPERPWQIAAQGSVGAGNVQRSLLFLLTRPSSRSVEIHMKKERSANPIVIRAKVKVLPGARARRAHLAPTFGYVVARYGGPVGQVGKVVIRGQAGSQFSSIGRDLLSWRRIILGVIADPIVDIVNRL
jgi:hypothetical protein